MNTGLRFAITVLLCLGFGAMGAYATIDVTKKPAPGPVAAVRFPNFQTLHLANGLKIFVIEDHEQPTVAFRVQIGVGSIVDPAGKAGAMEMLVDMLTKGTTTRSALDIAQALDSIGASLTTSAGGDALYIVLSGLKKYSTSMLTILADILQHPTFPETELAKYKQQAIAGLQHEKTQPFSIANKLARKVIYGKHHPYSQAPTEESINSISAADLRQLHQQYFVPNLLSIAVVGDITPTEVQQWMDSFFGKWEQHSVQLPTVPAPKVAPAGVYFIERPGSVQSTIVATALGVPYAHPDYEKLRLAAEMLGSGFGGWFFRTLRETYGYTYTPFAFLTRARYANRFVGAADVRNPVTDSALTVMIDQIVRLGTEGPKEAELYRIKRHSVGSYLMAFESSDFVASLIQRADLFGESFDHLKQFPQRYLHYTPQEVRSVAARYLAATNLRFVVVGDPSVLEKLENFGNIYRYDLDLNPLTDTATAGESISFSINKILDRYERAVGGKEKINQIHTLQAKGSITMASGPRKFSGELLKELKRPDQGHYKLQLPTFTHEVWVSKDRVWEQAMNQPVQEKSGAEAEELRRNLLLLFPLLDLEQMGYTLQVDGLRQGKIVIKAISPSGKTTRYFVDPKSYLITKIERMIDNPNGGTTPVVEEILEYTEVEGVQLPKRTRTRVGPVTITEHIDTYKVNISLDDHRFVPPTTKEQKK